MDGESPSKHAEKSRSLLSTAFSCSNLSTLPFIYTLPVASVSEPCSQPVVSAELGPRLGETRGKMPVTFLGLQDLLTLHIELLQSHACAHMDSTVEQADSRVGLGKVSF